MKKRIVTVITALMLVVSVAGCGDPSKLTSKKSSEAAVIEEVTQDTEKADAPAEGAGNSEEAQNQSSEETSGQGESAESQNGGSSASDTGEKKLSVTSEGVEFDPDEIVEPALPGTEQQSVNAASGDETATSAATETATDTTASAATEAATETATSDVTEAASTDTPAQDQAAATEAEASSEAASTEPKKEKKEKKDKYYDIVFIGDSQFDNARGTASDIPSYTCSLLGKKVKFYNLAIGGTAASLSRDMGIDLSNFDDSCFIGISYALAGKIDSSFLDQYPAGEELKKVDPEKVDLYVVEYGANDYINGKDLFNSNYLDYHTYSGALAEGLNTLKSVSPKAQFILCGPSYCVWYNADGYLIGDSYTVSKGIGTLSEYSNTASNLASSMGIDFMDSMYASQFDLKMETIDDYLSDGLHYNEKGRQIYAAVLAHRIQKLRGLDDSEMPYLEINNFDFWEYSKSLKKK